MDVECWVMVDPEGRVLIDTLNFKDEKSVWTIVLGWPPQNEIDQALKDGYRVFKSRVLIEHGPTRTGTD